MPMYTCRLGTTGGEVLVQDLEAASERALRSQLEEKGYFVFSVRAKHAWSGLAEGLFRKGQKVSERDFILFNQEFTALLKAGLPMLTALDLLLARKQKGPFPRMLAQVRDDVQAGASLSEAFKNRGKAFPAIYSATIAAGERSGELVAVIQRYLFFLRTIQGIRKKITSAMIYPILLMTLSVGLVFLLLTVIVPKFAALFTGAGATLPALTRIVLSVSAVFQYGWPFFVAAIVLVPTALRVIASRPQGRLWLAGVRLKLPVLGMNIRRYNISQMCRTLGTLVSGGIPVVSALDVVADAMGNEVYKTGLKQVKKDVQEGQALWSSMERTRMMTPLSVEMIEVGESTGALAEMLEQVSSFYDEELGTAVERFVALLEPMLLLFMAVIIAIVVLSVYMPLFSMYNLVGG
jgi:type IV pilus assembly protein PilC